MVVFERILTFFGINGKQAKENERQFQAALAWVDVIQAEMESVMDEIELTSAICRDALQEGKPHVFADNYKRRSALLIRYSELYKERQAAQNIAYSYDYKNGRRTSCDSWAN